MKRILSAICTLSVLSFAVLSCSEELTYTAGEKDSETCYHVYFPEDQDVTGEISLTPTASKTLTLTAKRQVTSGAIEVPVEIESGSPEYFTAGTLNFAEGSDEASVTVTIAEDTPLDTLISCSVKISDPQYASMNGSSLS